MPVDAPFLVIYAWYLFTEAAFRKWRREVVDSFLTFKQISIPVELIIPESIVCS